MGTEALCLQGHVLLGLRVERWIFNECIYEHPNVIFHLKYKQ